MEERIKFVRAYQALSLNMTDLCVLFGVSRKTGYKWLERPRPRRGQDPFPLQTASGNGS